MHRLRLSVQTSLSASNLQYPPHQDSDTLPFALWQREQLGVNCVLPQGTFADK